MAQPQIAPSLMCMDVSQVAHDVESMDRSFDLYHVDIMDGHFCPNMALTPQFANSLRKITNLPIDVHLMVEDPAMFVEMLELGPQDSISFQAETIERNAFRLSQRVHDKGNRFGVVLSPSTPLSAIEGYKERIDILTIMTVDTGFAGQRFIPEMLAKIEAAKKMRDEAGLGFQIQLDGQCNESTFRTLYDTGADILIVGSSGLFSLAEDIDDAIVSFKESFEAKTGVAL
ncbi:MAG: ribulose-phosphate 3-epimerase [Atopobiaceae bacterium]|jgi:D-allulose-6-phosphate 3-epimerase|uniref:Ribulose-phosphate 3-epimerase n=1 Tax=Muricaecibacterium torontonense TaxID=3032871 RepID=A0A4S2F293_9ACTN|nr:D-allulose 6-phosphate 3-epimerase [Muricaecibacterium torontonense]MCI8676648.1 ribulose-phosphate 3-epimerase [Atopobiaceae bacterium]TGY62467.1 ribulose-phosphate 3-epimerase [Muricaecibacterium torontonense]